MKKSPLIFLAFLLVFVFMFIACTTLAISKKNPERWENTKIGMSLDDFKKIWPEAQFNGYGDFQNKTEIWTVTDRVSLSVNYAKIAFFTFENNKLIRISEK